VTYAAEPYAQFVDDLLSALTGGAVRDEFRFLPELAPFQLSVSAPVLPKSVRVFGLADGKYTRFRFGTDFTVAQDGAKGSVVWASGGPRSPVVLPDLGSTFYVNYELQGSSPALTDRNTGSITRLLAESFAREYATVSKQLEGVYESAFLDTAKGRDLDQLAALVGVVRRRRLSASGSVVFSRIDPAPADIAIPAGTKLSTAEAPAVVFETTEDRTLQRGSLSVDAPVTAVQAGAGGLVGAEAIAVMNRPILGIDAVNNPLPMRFSDADESDELLRGRCRRALETAGRATTESLLGALTAIPGLAEKDIRIAEDYLVHPGIVKLNIAPPAGLSGKEFESFSLRVWEAIEATRPVGIRIQSNIVAPRPPGAATPGAGAVAENTGSTPAAVGVTGAGAMAVDVDVIVTPTTLALSTDERARLTKRVENTVAAFIGDAGVGEVLVYNRLVTKLMAIDGVLDVSLSLREHGSADPGRKNLIPDDPAAKAVAGDVNVALGGALIMLDVALDITITNAALGPPDREATKLVARDESAVKLDAFVATLSNGTLNRNLLRGALPDTATYKINDLHYKVDYTDAGVRIRQQDVEIPLSDLERVWIRKVEVNT